VSFFKNFLHLRDKLSKKVLKISEPIHASIWLLTGTDEGTIFFKTQGFSLQQKQVLVYDYLKHNRRQEL
jgi:hypothetical protein